MGNPSLMASGERKGGYAESSGSVSTPEHPLLRAPCSVSFPEPLFPRLEGLALSQAIPTGERFAPALRRLPNHLLNPVHTGGCASLELSCEFGAFVVDGDEGGAGANVVGLEAVDLKTVHPLGAAGGGGGCDRARQGLPGDRSKNSTR